MRKVQAITDAVQMLEGEGMVVRRAIPNQAARMVDPFILLDHMGPHDNAPGEAKGAPDHPHRGFETVTYVLDGALEHKDSVGNEGHLGAGDVQWMTAGSGVVHSEMPAREIREHGGVVHGLQLWVNLPKKDKMMPPRYQDIPAASIPEVTVPAGTVRVIAGRFQDVEAVIDTRTPITYLHADLRAGDIELPVPEGHHAFVYVIHGTGTVAEEAVKEGQNVLLGEQGEAVRLSTETGLSAILVTGLPLREPVFQWGPFVMNSREEIEQAVQDFQEGRMGQIRHGDTVVVLSKDGAFRDAMRAMDGTDTYDDAERAAQAVRRHPRVFVIGPDIDEPLRGHLQRLAASSGVRVLQPTSIDEARSALQ